MTYFKIVAAIVVTLNGLLVQAADIQYEKVKETLKSMTGCYLVDYSYTEVESLKPGYARDSRVYDVNKNKTVKEWIYSEDISPNRIRLQHVLFMAGLDGKVVTQSLLRHQAEDWEFNAPFLYDFVSPKTWNVKTLNPQANIWTRRITNLDDGLRYQCAAAWDLSSANPTWTCSDYAPIPGRETRDMGRKDYNALMRTTQVVAYPTHWLERQDNIKVNHQADGTKEQLARELGKNWYIRLPDADCKEAESFAQSRRAFWTVLREAWDEVFIGDRPFVEKTVPGAPSRYEQILGLEQQYNSKAVTSPSYDIHFRDAVRQVIKDFRAN